MTETPNTSAAHLRESEFDLTLTPRRDESHRRFIDKANVGTPILGTIHDRFAVYCYPRRPSRQRGGARLGRYIVWWSR
jgi:hypothetical protein